MKVYLVRHAEAVPADERGESVGGGAPAGVAGGAGGNAPRLLSSALRDDDRFLTARGREAARGLARLLREQRVEPDAILSSPLPRALQTAELLADGLDFLGVVEVLPALRPGAHPRVAATELVTRGAAVLVVGHEPTISSLGAFLLGRPAFPAFRTAQCCAIEDNAPTFSARADVMQTAALFLD